jgi:hypothetical protein
MPLVEAASHSKARGQKSKAVHPLALRIDAIFAIEREILRFSPAERKGVRQARSKPLVAALEAWLHETRDKLTTWLRPSITCCGNGPRSFASSETAASVSATTPPSACAASL